MFLQNKTAVGKVKTGPYLIHIQMECLQYVPVNSSQFQNCPSPRANQTTTLHRKVILLNLQKQYKERKVGPTKTHDDKGGKFLPI